MRNETERKFFRRNLLIGAGAAIVLTACDPSSIFQSEQDQKQDKENGPQMGDIIVAGGEAELLRNEMRYQVRDLPTYLRRSKNPGKIFEDPEVARKIFQQYPEGKISFPHPVDIAQGDIKRINPDGGEKLIFAQGFLSSDSKPHFQIIPREDAFVVARKRAKTNGWDPEPDDPKFENILFLDSYVFSYNEDELKIFDILDTFEDPGKINGVARRFMKKRMEQNPFDQNDGSGHSLGGNYILEMAMAHPDAFNNLIFLNSPIMGLNINVIQRLVLELFKKNIVKLGVDPTKVIDYLSKLWNEENHKKVKKFMTDFTKRGGKVLIVYTKGDVIAPRESTGIDEFKDIKGVETLTVDAGDVNPFNPIEVFQAHGLALSDKTVLNKSEEMVGKNLSTS